MVERLTATYDDGRIFWRGSRTDYVYVTPEDAEKMRAIYARDAERGDRGVPGYADRCKAFAHDLTNAIEAYWEQADAES